MPAGLATRCASSGGESRLTRAAYGKDAIYTRMALDRLPQWKELSAVAGLPIFVPTGVLFFFPTLEALPRRASVAAHRKLGLPSELLAPERNAAPLPDDRLHRRQSGPVRARLRGADGPPLGPDVGRPLRSRRRNRMCAARSPRPLPEPSGSIDSVTLKSGEKIAADRFVFALGPWLPKAFPDLLGRGSSRPARKCSFSPRPPATGAFSRAQCRAGPISTAATSSTAFPTSRIAASNSPTTRTAPSSIPTRRTAGRARRR